MTKVEELFNYLNERNLTIGGLTPGPEATAESVAEAILYSLRELEMDGVLAQIQVEPEQTAT